MSDMIVEPRCKGNKRQGENEYSTKRFKKKDKAIAV